MLSLPYQQQQRKTHYMLSKTQASINRHHTHTHAHTHTNAYTHTCAHMLTSGPTEISEDGFDRCSNDNHNDATRVHTNTRTLTQSRSHTPGRTHARRSAGCSRQTSSSSSSDDADPLSSHLPPSLSSTHPASPLTPSHSFARSLSFFLPF